MIVAEQRVRDRMNAVNNGLRFHDPEFSKNFHEISFRWFKIFKDNLTNFQKFRWNLVDTFIVIPVDAANEKYLYETLREYSIQQDLSFFKYGFVLFLNSKSGKNEAEIGLNRFKSEFPWINLTSYFHTFNEDERKVLDIAKIRNTGINFVLLMITFLKKDPKKIILIGADADAQKVSNNYLEEHRRMLLTTDPQTNKNLTATVGKWIWGLTGDFEKDLILLIDRAIMELARENYPAFTFAEDEYITTYPSESMSSTTLATYLSFLGLQAYNAVSENQNLIYASNITSNPIALIENTGVITDPRRALKYIGKGGNIFDLNGIWTNPQGWEGTGDANRISNPENPRHKKVFNPEEKRKIIQEIIDKLFKHLLRHNLKHIFDTDYYDEQELIESINNNSDLDLSRFNYMLFSCGIRESYLLSLRKTMSIINKLSDSKIEIDIDDFSSSYFDSEDFVRADMELYLAIIKEVCIDTDQKIMNNNIPESQLLEIDPENLTDTEILFHEVKFSTKLTSNKLLMILESDPGNILNDFLNLKCPIVVGSKNDSQINFNITRLVQNITKDQAHNRRRDYQHPFITLAISWGLRLLNLN